MKPSNPRGTRDFSPDQMARRNHIFDTCRRTFKKYGYLPIETPAMENLETLTGKYGEEGDNLLFQILNRGKTFSINAMELINEVRDTLVESTGEVTGEVIVERLKRKQELALRYDLTVPFARFVVQHQGEITFPFKRYQIQPVWRADRPQKGRYREFYQCDIDVVGSGSRLNEVELLLIIDEVFTALELRDVSVHVNNRKILVGAAGAFGIADKFTDMVTALDKWDKIGKDGVATELADRGIAGEAVAGILSYATCTDLDELPGLAGGEQTDKGVEELSDVLKHASSQGLGNVKFDPTLARGIDYYTGIIIEVKAKNFPGSLCAGGRYDDLTGLFGLKGVSGVGISFGADRIYDIMEQEDLFPPDLTTSTVLMFANFGEKEAAHCLRLAVRLRAAGISVELYPDAAKMKKQLTYADAKSIPYVGLAGSEEIASGKITLKHMASGGQQSITEGELVEILKNHL